MKYYIILIALLLSISNIEAQSLNLPPQAANQYSSVTQGIGIARVTIEYHSPDVNNREDNIWGKLVPYNDGKPFPWRAGANENTIFTFSHDMRVNGSAIKAVSYGFHIIPSQNEWVLIFSKDYTNWGSFNYNEQNDALRIKVRPEKSSFSEFLDYRFTVKSFNKAVVVMSWENLQILITIETDQKKLMLASLRQDLKGAAGAGPTSWKNWVDAAGYSFRNNLGNDDEALQWVQRSIGFNPSFLGFATKYNILNKMGKAEEAKKSWEKAVELGSNEDLYRLGRILVARKNYELAVATFEKNKEKFNDLWPVNLGLGRGYLASGDKKKAKKYLEKALAQAKTERQKSILNGLIKQTL